MSTFVYFEILGPGEHLAASLERARERFLAGVHPDVIDQLVLGLKRPAFTLAPVPEARVRRALGPTDVLDRDVRHDVLHGAEHLAACAHRRPGLVDPQAGHIFERGDRGGRYRPVPHVPVERSARVIAGSAGTTAATAAVQVLAVVVVPRVDRADAGRRGQRWLRRLRVHLAVVVMVVQLQVVVDGRIQAAQVVFTGVLVMVPVVVRLDVPADLQELPRSRVARMVRRRRRWRLPVVHVVMVLVLRRCHVIVLDLDAHAVGQRRVVHKRV